MDNYDYQPRHRKKSQKSSFLVILFIIIVVVALIVIAAIAIFKPSWFSSSSKSTKTTITTTTAPKKPTTTSTKTPSFPYSAITTTTAPTSETTSGTTTAPTTIIVPTTTATPIETMSPALITNMTIWLDAMKSSNWLGDTWVNNAPAATKTSNAVYTKGVWSASSWVLDAINGYPGIKFTGYNALKTSDAAGTYSAGVTIFVIFQPTGVDTYPTLVSRTLSTTTYPAPFDMYSNVRFVGNSTQGTHLISSIDLRTVSINNPYLFTYRISNSSGTASVSEWWNGNMQYTDLKLTGYNDVANSVCIGTRETKDTSFTGYIGEVMVYKIPLTNSQVNDMNLFLLKKWNIPITGISNVISGCYVRIQRCDNQVQFVNIAEIQALDINGNKYTATSTWQSTTPYSEYPSSLVADNDPNTFANTDAQTNSCIQIGLGENKDIATVVIVNRKDCCQDRMVGCALQIFKSDSLNHVVYVGSKITASQFMYQFTFNIQNVLNVEYYGLKGTEKIWLNADNIFLSYENPVGTSRLSRTFKLGFVPININLTYMNDDTTSGDVYLAKLEFNGTDLVSKYVNSNAKIQTAVRNGTLAWGMNYSFPVS